MRRATGLLLYNLNARQSGRILQGQKKRKEKKKERKKEEKRETVPADIYKSALAPDIFVQAALTQLWQVP